MHRQLVQALASEFAGTFALVFAGTGAIVVNHASNGAVTHVGIALTFGLVIAAGIAAFGEHSGAHFNPAVTVCLVAARRFPAFRAPSYVIVQLIAATAASAVLRSLFPYDPTLGATVPNGAWQLSFWLEAIMTLFLVGAIVLVTAGENPFRPLAPLAIGGVVALDALFGGPISGASMNPARSFGPALVAGQWNYHWVYWLAPMLAALFAAGVARFFNPIKPAHE
jgi:aquaporin Z